MPKPLEGGIAKLVAKGLKAAKMTMAVTLLKSAAGTRTPGALAGGTNPTTVGYPAKAIRPTRTAQKIGGTLVEEGDRITRIVGASLPSGIYPTTADRVTLDGETLRIVGVETDSARAMYTLLARK